MATTGDIAPDFALETLQGSMLRLSELRGKKVLISFLRNAQCAMCNLWVHTTRGHAEGWRQAGLEVVAVFESTADKLRLQFGDKQPPFAVLADPDGAVHEAFGSRNDPERVQAIVASGAAKAALERAAQAGFVASHEPGANFFRTPSEVLLGHDGRLAHVHHADEVTNHLAVEVIEQFLASEG